MGDEIASPSPSIQLFLHKILQKNRSEGDVKKYPLAAAAGKRFWIIFLSVDSLVWIFAIGGTRVDPLHNGPLMCCRDTGGGGRRKSPIFIPEGTYHQKYPPNLSQSSALILRGIFHKHWNERKLNSFQNLIFQNLQ